MPEQTSKWQLLISNDDRTSTEVPVLKKAILENLFYAVGKRPEVATT